MSTITPAAAIARRRYFRRFLLRPLFASRWQRQRLRFFPVVVPAAVRHTISGNKRGSGRSGLPSRRVVFALPGSFPPAKCFKKSRAIGEYCFNSILHSFLIIIQWGAKRDKRKVNFFNRQQKRNITPVPLFYLCSKNAFQCPGR